jgi:hypothetical protein
MSQTARFTGKVAFVTGASSGIGRATAQVERMRALYRYRKRRLAARAGKIEDEGYEDRSLAYQHMVQLVLWAQRDALLQMRSEGTLSNEVMNRILRELDLEESRLETTGTPQPPATRPRSATTHA